MRQRQRGFTFIEAMLGMMVILTAASFIAPAFARDLVLGRVMWEHRLAVKFIESRLDQDCQAGFAAAANQTATAIASPTELAAVSGTWERSVSSINANLKSIVVTVRWNSQGQNAFESSAPYYISQVGVCG